MSVLPWCVLPVAGGVGALMRFLLDRITTSHTGGSFPSGTLVVNLSGATVLGFLAGLALPAGAALVAGTGVVGSYTTFSTWMLETQRLAEEHQRRLAIVNVVASVVLGIAAAGCGQLIGARL